METCVSDTELVDLRTGGNRRSRVDGKIAASTESVQERSPPYKKVREDSIDLTSKYVAPAPEDRAGRDSSGSDAGMSSSSKIPPASSCPPTPVMRTSCSRAVARKMCSKPANKVVVQPKAPPEEPEEDEVSSDGSEDCIDLFEDDEEDINYHQTDQKDLFCEVCGKEFSVVKQFIFHHRRHSSIDHYQCPTCLRGFITLKACYTHEVRKHQRNGNNNKTTAMNEDSSDDEDASFSNRILPSNSLQGYRGPPVNHPFECYDIDDKYGFRDRNRYLPPPLQ